MKEEKGQALAIIILIVLVVLTVGLTVATRTLTGLKETTKQEESIRAYDAAEAGVEEALLKIKNGVGVGTTGTGTLAESQSQYIYEIQSLSGLVGSQFSFRVEKDQSYQVNLDVDDDSLDGKQINIYWWKQNPLLEPSEVDPDVSIGCGSLDPAIAALEFSYLRQDASGYSIAQKEIYDYCSTARSNNFSTPSYVSFNDSQNNTFLFEAAASGSSSITLQTDIKRILRITPRYNSTWVLIDVPTGESLPTQGFIIVSKGISGETERVIKVSRSVASLPSIFDFSIFSGSDQPLQK